jgi:hypothetical protein
MFAYVVNASIDSTLFTEYFSWLKDHILGNESKDIKGMLTVKNEQINIFNRADVYVGDLENGQKFISIHYMTTSKALIDIFLMEHAIVMRSELPEKFIGQIEYSRYVRNIATTDTIILPPENQVHRDFLNNKSEKLQLVEVYKLN